MTAAKDYENGKDPPDELELEAEAVKDLDVDDLAAEQVLGGGGSQGSHSTLKPQV